MLIECSGACVAAKPGECPAAGGVVGIAVQQCDNDLDCKDSRKCCSIGAGHQCRDPVYGECSAVRGSCLW